MIDYKLSKYITSVEINSFVIVYSLRTCKITKLSKVLWDFLSKDCINLLPIEIIDHLKEISILVPAITNEFQEINDENKLVYSSNTLYEVIQPSADCQMGCFYCGQNHERKNISDTTIDKITDAIENKIKNGNFDNLYIGWFGAEPLIGLTQMKSITSKLLLICEKYSLSYNSKVVTNGLKLTLNVFEELNKNLGVNHIEFTIDGVDEYHNTRRNLKNNTKGTFLKIIKNVKGILNVNSDCKISIRCNVDRNNEMSVIPLIDLLDTEGILNKVHFYTAKIHEWGEKSNKEHLVEFNYEESEIKWLKHLISKKYLPSLLPMRKHNVCLATNSTSNVYDTYGNVFKCTEIPYTTNYEKSKYFIGKIDTFSRKDEITFRDDWIEKIKNNESFCYNCNFYPVCGGACPKSWEENNIPCPSFKFNMKEKLEIYYSLNDYNND